MNHQFIPCRMLTLQALAAPLMPMRMPISIHPTKRRRLDSASSALSQPFKSPLKVPLRRQEDVEKQTDTSERHNHRNNRAAIIDRTTSKTQSTTTPSRQPPPTQSATNHANNHPQLIPLQKQQSALLLQLSKLRQSLDIAQQALKIESSNTDAELELLISKWKLASREAAEEIFRGAKDRVNRMGGMGAWRERERNQKKPGGWDDEPKVDVEDLSDEEQKEQLEVQNAECEAERRQYAPGKAEVVVERDDGSDDDDDDFDDVSCQLTNTNMLPSVLS
jgi:hypothetical protein